MSIKTRLAALEKVARDKGSKSIDGPQPPVRAAYQREDGTFDHEGYIADADLWSIEVFGKPLALVAEEIVENEGF
ncbi:hypothetical protein AU509_13390 [Lonsdalea britannica]|uniref:Uncharacterized protein n=1 Tax=Lonsdalea britannica TaxID=1082704 RepID=A0AAD0WJB8_9GAMM|nr:hypothetical protein [Lonsdalea britannica]AXW85744.1 hypothetical protein CKQ53_01275 [Lonsdalea britannica]OSM95525.1 hypothetical protein AU509_13390 [Lonsdalea britannica]